MRPGTVGHSLANRCHSMSRLIAMLLTLSHCAAVGSSSLLVPRTTEMEVVDVSLSTGSPGKGAGRSTVFVPADGYSARTVIRLRVPKAYFQFQYRTDKPNGFLSMAAALPDLSPWEVYRVAMLEAGKPADAPQDWLLRGRLDLKIKATDPGLWSKKLGDCADAMPSAKCDERRWGRTYKSRKLTPSYLDDNGLRHFLSQRPGHDAHKDFYLPEKTDGAAPDYLICERIRPRTNAWCRARTRTLDGLLLVQYSFMTVNLKDWQRIEVKVRELMESMVLDGKRHAATPLLPPLDIDTMDKMTGDEVRSYMEERRKAAVAEQKRRDREKKR